MRNGIASFCMVVTAAFGAVAADDLSVAREALRDGLWEIARTHARTAGDSGESRLIILESLAGEGRWDEVSRALGEWPDAKGDAFDYYRAVVKGDHKGAMDILKRGGSAEGLVEVRLHEAENLAKSGRRTDAESVWSDIAAQTNVGKRAFAIASMNLMDAALLRRAYETVDSVAVRRQVGLRLGTALLKDEKTKADGERLVRRIAQDSPDAEGAKDALLFVADMQLAQGRWKDALGTYREAIETWPATAKMSAVQEGLGWTLQRLGRLDEALEAFRSAESLAADDDARATVIAKQGDVLSELGREKESAARYQEVVEKYPKTTVLSSPRWDGK